MRLIDFLLLTDRSMNSSWGTVWEKERSVMCTKRSTSRQVSVLLALEMLKNDVGEIFRFGFLLYPKLNQCLRRIIMGVVLACSFC